MLLTRWSDFDRAFAEMEALTRGMATPRTTGLAGFRTEETDTAWTLSTDVPGLATDDVHVTVQGHLLKIEAERTVEPPEGYSALRRERRSWRLDRELRLPDTVDLDNIRATVANGVLTLTLPKRAETQPRRIEVK